VFFLAAHLAPADRLPQPDLRGAVFRVSCDLEHSGVRGRSLSSFVLSLIFLGEERLLRKHELGNMVWRLPPLELLERMSQSSVLVGLVSTRDRDGTGIRLGGPAHGPILVFTIRSMWSRLFVLLLYALYFRLAANRDMGGGRALRSCAFFNFVVVVLSFTVVNLYLSHSHRYFLGVIEPRHGNRSRRIESPDSAP